MAPALIEYDLSSYLFEEYENMTILVGKALSWAITTTAGSGFLLCVSCTSFHIA